MREILRFAPLYFEKVWGGSKHRDYLGREIPPELHGPIGESWELVDRPEAQSIELSSSKTLNEIWLKQQKQVFGSQAPSGERFPLLIKIIDASEPLSLQVHPPVEVAQSLGGEPKTEMWYFLRTEPGAKIFAGFSRVVTPEEFAQAARRFATQDMYHEIVTHAGDAMFLYSGRVHAIGAGNLLLEVQQNSDTTYRVDDWGRVGLDGKPRELHLDKALCCIDFTDVRPSLQTVQEGLVVSCPFFSVRVMDIEVESKIKVPVQSFVHVIVDRGAVKIRGEHLAVGESVLLPAAAGDASVVAEISPARLVLTTWGNEV